MTKENSDKLNKDIQDFLNKGGKVNYLPPSKINSELKYLFVDTPPVTDEEIEDWIDD